MPLHLPDDLSPLQKLEARLFENRVLATTLLLGLLLVGFGLFLFRSGVFESATVEVLEGGQARLAEDDESRRVTVEIAGAVEKPGVYQLLASERVERLLILAGGLASEADREWVEKNLNRAAKLVDGQKVYVPKQGDPTSSRPAGLRGAGGGVVGSSTGLINLNTASQSELESLWGIGQARAKAIIDNRPYSSSQELLSKKVIPQNVYDKIKDEITAP